MARPVKFKPIKTEKSGWRLNVPAGYTESGKREQLFFPTREKANEAAQKYKDKKESFGKQAKSIRPTLADAATQAQEILRPYGISVLEAAKRVAKMEREARASRLVTEAVAAFLETKEKLSVSRLREYGDMEKTLIKHFGERILSEVSGEEIEEAAKADTGTAKTFKRRIEDTVRFINWAAHAKRKWASVEQIEFFEPIKTKKGKTQVMTPDQARAILRAAEEHYPETVPAFVLMLFMGVRPSEVDKMSSKDITEDGVTIPDEDEETGEATKTGRRFINMTPIVSEWLKHYQPGERITPPNWERRYDAVRRLAGWGVKADLFKKTELYDTSGLPKWHQDILRHTAATVVINLGKPMTVLIFEHGHTQGEATLKKHYLGRMTKRQALEILSIGPKGSEFKPQTLKAV